MGWCACHFSGVHAIPNVQISMGGCACHLKRTNISMILENSAQVHKNGARIERDSPRWQPGLYHAAFRFGSSPYSRHPLVCVLCIRSLFGHSHTIGRDIEHVFFVGALHTDVNKRETKSFFVGALYADVIKRETKTKSA